MFCLNLAKATYIESGDTQTIQSFSSISGENKEKKSWGC